MLGPFVAEPIFAPCPKGLEPISRLSCQGLGHGTHIAELVTRDARLLDLRAIGAVHYERQRSEAKAQKLNADAITQSRAPGRTWNSLIASQTRSKLNNRWPLDPIYELPHKCLRNAPIRLEPLEPGQASPRMRLEAEVGDLILSFVW